MSRANGFNQNSIRFFFDNLLRVLEKYEIPPEKIYNLDETAVTAVLQAPRIIAATGIKQIGHTVSTER
ncbi:hypothetical protein ILUMI_05888, partial [Ignelater luminosus]